MSLVRERVESFKEYPFSIPAIRALKTLELHPKVTFLVGENGSGKSTLIEAIAVAAGFNAEGGNKNFNFATTRTESDLHEALQLKRGVRREKTGFFLRAESFYNAASYVNEIGVAGWYGGSLHAKSHGESFMALVEHKFKANGLYILDEPESALSPMKQLALLQEINRLVTREGSQFIVASHSPILMAFPDALIYHITNDGLVPIAYERTEHYQVTLDFLNNRASYFRQLFDERSV